MEIELKSGTKPPNNSNSNFRTNLGDAGAN